MESDYSYDNVGRPAVNLRSNRDCIIIRENKITGQIQTIESIKPLVVNTHDSWDTLLLMDNR